MRFVKSLKYALRGIVYCINNERNMRIHTVAVLYVLAFSPFFEMSRARYAILLVTFALVLTAETFNTVAEELCDLVAPSFHPVVRIVKDMAAGGVLICAGFAVGVGVCLFWQPAAFLRIWRYFLDNPATDRCALGEHRFGVGIHSGRTARHPGLFPKEKLPRTP